MLFYKWCPFLTRTMSPLIVGLIWCCLVGVSSLTHHSTNSSTRSAATVDANLKNNANHSSFAKDNILHRKRLFTGFRRTTSRDSISSKPIINNGSIETPGARNRKMPHLHLNSRLKVRNASEANSTIVFLPRLNRSMGNSSEKSEKHDLQPIIVSKHRRILLDPKEYKVRRSSDTRSHFPKDGISPQFGLKLKLKISPNSTRTSSGKFGPTSQLYTKTVKTTQAPNSLKVIRQASTNNPFYTESKVLVNIKNNKNGTGAKNPFVKFLPANISRNENRIISRIYRRKGRNFDVSDETSSEEFISFLSHNGNANYTSPNNASVRKKSLSPSHSLKDPAHQPDLSSLESYEQLFSNLGYSYTEKKANNLTIYEILKPRLKSNISETVIFSPENSSSWQNSTVNNQDIPEKGSFNTSSVHMVDGDDASNDTFVTNEIDDEIPNYENPMVIIPGRSDSSYGVEYIMVNRSNFAIIPPLENDDPVLSVNVESGADKNISSVIPSELYDTSSSINIESPNNENNSSLVSLETNDADISINREYGDNENNSSVKVFTEKGLNTSKNVYKIYKREGYINVAAYLPKDILRIKNEESSNVSSKIAENSDKALLKNASADNLSADGSEYRTLFYDSDSIRRPKMTETINNGNTPFKNPKIDSKIFYDYFAKRPMGNATLREFPYPEYRPGNMFRYSDIYQRKPVLDAVYTRPVSISLLKTDPVVVTEETASLEVNPTTFNSLRSSSSSVRVLSTYYPNRIQDVTMKFGNRIETTTVPNSSGRKPEYRSEYDPDDAEFKDSIDPGFTMEKLAYLLIGTCCGLSILCLFVVVIAIKCRRAIVEKRLKSQFKKRMYHHERMADMTSPWQQQIFDHFMYLHRRPEDSSCSSNTDSCNCRCVTWSLGARNLDATRPLCPTSRNSLYLYGQKKLPFGAASTLRFESMLGRKKSPDHIHQKTDSPHTDSSHENDSLDLDSDSREGDGPKQCTCIDYNLWQMPPPNVPRGFFTVCPNPRRYNVGNCSQHRPVDLRTIARDLPPPVTGSNYLDRSEGVVYWSSNDERLI